VTWWFRTIFNDADLSPFGDTRTRQLYAVLRQRQWKPPEAFRLLIDAYKHESAAGARRQERAMDPAHDMAEKIERALLAAMRT